MNAGARAAKGDLYLFLHADTVVPVGFDETLRGAFHDPKVLMTCFQFGVNRELLRGRPPVGLSLMERVTNYRTRKLHLPYGDQVNLSLGHAAGVPPPSPVHGRDRLRLSSVQATVEMAVDMRPYMDPHHLQVHVIIPDRTLHTRQAFCFSAHKFKAMGGFPNFVMMEDFEVLRRLWREEAAGGGEIRVLPQTALCSPRRWEKPGNNVFKNLALNWVFVFMYARLRVSPRQIFRLYYGRWPID